MFVVLFFMFVLLLLKYELKIQVNIQLKQMN